MRGNPPLFEVSTGRHRAYVAVPIREPLVWLLLTRPMFPCRNLTKGNKIALRSPRTVGTRGIQRSVAGFIDLEELEALPGKGHEHSAASEEPGK